MGKLNKARTIIIPSPSKHEDGYNGTIKEIYKYLSNGFDMTLNEVCSILSCSRSTAVELIVPNVSNIVLNSRIKSYLRAAWGDIIGDKKDKIPEVIENNAIYYFNRHEFYEYLKSNTVCTKQAHGLRLSFEEERKLFFKYEESKKQEKIEKDIPLHKELPPYLDRIVYFHAFRDVLEEIGYDNLSALLGASNPRTKKEATLRFPSSSLAFRRFDYEAFEVEIKDYPERLCSIKDAVFMLSVNSNEIAYRHIFLKCLRKYTLFDGKLIRYDREDILKGPKTFLILSDKEYNDWYKNSNGSHEF